MKLIQERYRGNAWKVLASCILLNRVSGEVAVPIIEKFFKRWPTPAKFRASGKWESMNLIKPLGLYHGRIQNLRKMADALLTNKPFDQIPGIGRYGQDSYLIFVEGRTDVDPLDKKLRSYLEGKNGLDTP